MLPGLLAEVFSGYWNQKEAPSGEPGHAGGGMCPSIPAEAPALQPHPDKQENRIAVTAD